MALTLRWCWDEASWANCQPSQAVLLLIPSGLAPLKGQLVFLRLGKAVKWIFGDSLLAAVC
eukprot:1400317-Amphidinium_carterae.1